MGGKVQEGFGRVTGDAKSQADGLINQATGAAQDLYRQAKDVNPRSILIRLVCGRLDRELVGHERLCWDAAFRARRRSPCDSGSVTRSARLDTAAGLYKSDHSRRGTEPARGTSS
jgi:hypothetical protein